jgi:hypothetical protein
MKSRIFNKLDEFDVLAQVPPKSNMLTSAAAVHLLQSSGSPNSPSPPSPTTRPACPSTAAPSSGASASPPLSPPLAHPPTPSTQTASPPSSRPPQQHQPGPAPGPPPSRPPLPAARRPWPCSPPSPGSRRIPRLSPSRSRSTTTAAIRAWRRTMPSLCRRPSTRTLRRITIRLVRICPVAEWTSWTLGQRHGRRGRSTLIQVCALDLSLRAVLMLGSFNDGWPGRPFSAVRQWRNDGDGSEQWRVAGLA